jgi:hypothetical protein
MLQGKGTQKLPTNRTVMAFCVMRSYGNENTEEDESTIYR